MAIVKSNEFVAAAQAVQHEVIYGMDTQPNMLIVRYYDPTNPDAYRPTRSYASQIRNHGARIGAATDEIVVTPGDRRSAADVIERAQDDPTITSVMPLFPLADRDKVLTVLDPARDADDLLGRDAEAPTALSMLTMANICLNGSTAVGGANYFMGMRVHETTALKLPETVPASHIRFGGEGALTGKPLRHILASQGIFIPDTHIATAATPERLAELPDRALVFSATPTAQQIKSVHIRPGSVIIDAGFGIIGGETFGNTEATVAVRNDVLWTPPVAGVGPGSTTHLWNRAIEAAGVSRHEMPNLGEVALLEEVYYQR